MFHRLKKVTSLSLFVLLGLSGCSTVGPSFSDMTGSYQKEVERYSNNSILLNVIRASKNMPMSFLDIPNVIGSGQISSSSGLSTSNASKNILGAANIAAAQYYSNGASLSLSSSRGFNFTQASLENEPFTKTFLSPLSLQNISFFTNGTYSKHLLFHLFVASIELQDKDNFVSLINDPNSVNYPDFVKVMNSLVDMGISIEATAPNNIPVGPAIDEQQLLKDNILSNYLSSPNRLGMLAKTNVDGKDKYQVIVSTPPVLRFCFNAAAQPKKVVAEFGEVALCQSSNTSNTIPVVSNPVQKSKPNNDASAFKSTQKSFGFKIRSPREVFAYLGTLTAKQLKEDNKNLVMVPTDFGIFTGTSQELIMQPVLVVQKSVPNNVFATINYDGESYGVSQIGNGLSADTMNILGQIVNICKIAGSLAPSPAVLIK
jgi:hypothetical protein